MHGRVLSVTDYGAFVELEQGIEGLVHVSEMTWSKRMKHPSKLVKVGDEVDAVVLNVNPQDRRISLGTEAARIESLGAPAREVSRWAAMVEGQVRNLTDFGAFIEIEDGIDGLVHVSNLSWTKRVKHPSEVLKKGDKVKAIVLGVEPENRRLSLGVKQLQPDVWETFFETASRGRRDPRQGAAPGAASAHSSRSPMESRVLCHNSEASDEHGAPLKLEPGQEFDFKIIKMNPEEKKVGLSLRAVGDEASRTDVENYKAPASSSPGAATIGELLSWKREQQD